MPAAQVVAAAGTAIVSAAKVGRFLSKSGWGLARRLPGGRLLEREVQRFQDVAMNEMRRVLEVGDYAGHAAMTGEEQRAVLLVQNGSGTGEPLRSAMNELLERSVETDRVANRDYLYGNVMSQLVPDEARILAALSDGSVYAVIDVVAKLRGRSATRPVLTNASSVGRAVGVTTLDAVPTYVTRLHQLGLVEIGPADESIAMQYEILATEAMVQAAEASIRAGKRGSPRLIHKSLTMSSFGQEFWAASDPSRREERPTIPTLPRGST
jgi:hypothetical protein